MLLRLSRNQFESSAYELISVHTYLHMLKETARTPSADFADIENRKKEQQFLRALDQKGRATAIIIDFDKLTPQERGLIIAHARKLAYQCLIHSTSQSTARAPRIRLIFPIKPGYIDIDATLHVLAFPIACDANAKGQYRGWYLPSIHAEPIWRITVGGQKLTPIYRVGVTRADALTLSELEHVDTDDANANNEHLVRIRGSSNPLAIWLKAQIAYEVEDFADSADSWLRRWLEQKGYELRGNQTNAGPGHIGYEMVCPDCKTASAGIILDIASGRRHIHCRRPSCSFVENFKSTIDEPYDVLNSRFIIHRLGFRFKIQKLKNVWTRWWVQGDLFFKESTILGCVCGLTGLPMDRLRSAASTLYCDIHGYDDTLPPVDQSMIQSCAALLEEDRVQGSLGERAFFTNLKCIASSSPNTIARLTEGLTPMHWQRLDLLQWKTPSIEINNTPIKILPGKSSQQPIGVVALLSLGYRLWTERTLKNRLGALSPTIFINPKRMLTDGENHPRTIMLRQRILLALARGCNVYLIFPCSRDQMQSHMSILGIPRDQSTSLRKLLNVE